MEGEGKEGITGDAFSGGEEKEGFLGREKGRREVQEIGGGLGCFRDEKRRGG